jgi:hypothetical protein
VKLTFIENVMANLMTLGALRPFHALTGELGKLDRNATGLWKVASGGKVVLAEAGKLTIETLVAAGAAYVSARLVEGQPPPSEAIAVSWAMQGAAMAVGKFIHGRMQEVSDNQDAGAFVLRYFRAVRSAFALPGDAYVAYLTTKDRVTSAQSLDDALVAVGRSDEVVLWRAWCAGEPRTVLASGVWRDRTVHLGVSPPRSAEIGDLWFDVCEVSLMVHAGRTWLGTRPTGQWQMRGFLDVAERTLCEVLTNPPHTTLDRDRLLSGVDESAAADLTCDEATQYAWWFGKTVPHLFDWQSAAEYLPPEQVKALWSGRAKEWTSLKFADDDPARIFVTPSTINENPRTSAEDDTRAALMIARDDTHKWNIGFRTSVHIEQGRLHAAPSSQPAVEGIGLASRLDRSSFR